MKAFLEALPAVATSPLALVAYLATLFVWAIIALQNRRISTVMRNIKLIPEKDRKSLLETEMGIKLPEEVSAEDWLKARRQTYLFWALLVLVLAILTIVALAVFARTATVTSMPKLGGLLTPANERDPPVSQFCQDTLKGEIKPEDQKLFLGSFFIVVTPLQQELAVLGLCGKTVVSLKWKPEGVSVSADVFGQDTRIVAQIVDNEFYVNPNNYFRIERPDNHTLVVYDQYAHEVLDVRVHNRTSVSVTGRFYSSRLECPPAIVTKEYTLWNDSKWSGACFLGNISEHGAMIEFDW
jgi:hypothetical protein